MYIHCVLVILNPNPPLTPPRFISSFDSCFFFFCMLFDFLLHHHCCLLLVSLLLGNVTLESLPKCLGMRKHCSRLWTPEKNLPGMSPMIKDYWVAEDWRCQFCNPAGVGTNSASTHNKIPFLETPPPVHVNTDVAEQWSAFADMFV